MLAHSAMRPLAIGAILLSCLGCDQATKRLAMERLKGQAAHSFCGDLLRLEYAENPGAFLGVGGQLGATARWVLLVGVNSLLTLGVVAALVLGRRMSLVRLAGCGLLAAGAVGNLIDRVRFDGLVIDFLNVGLGPLRTGIFNVADMAIMTGAALVVLAPGARPSAGGQAAGG